MNGEKYPRLCSYITVSEGENLPVDRMFRVGHSDVAIISSADGLAAFAPALTVLKPLVTEVPNPSILISVILVEYGYPSIPTI